MPVAFLQSYLYGITDFVGLRLPRAEAYRRYLGSSVQSKSLPKRERDFVSLIVLSERAMIEHVHWLEIRCDCHVVQRLTYSVFLREDMVILNVIDE